MGLWKQTKRGPDRPTLKHISTFLYKGQNKLEEYLIDCLLMSRYWNAFYVHSHFIKFKLMQEQTDVVIVETIKTIAL